MTDDRVAVITGADSGIGKGAAVALARRGFDVGTTYRSDRQGAEGTAREVGSEERRAAVHRHDLTDPEKAAGAVDDLAGELGGLGR